jgi:hypothetical protein
MTIFDVCLELRDCLGFVYMVLTGICYKLRCDGKKDNKFCCEERLYEKLGLKDEDEKARKAREEACDRRSPVVVLNENGDELVCADDVRTNPIMCLGSRYKDMCSFRLAMREYAIRNEFELGIESSSPIKY